MIPSDFHPKKKFGWSQISKFEVLGEGMNSLVQSSSRFRSKCDIINVDGHYDAHIILDIDADAPVRI
jgi:hypothetical protein